MKIILASALPEVNAFFGLRHHYPVRRAVPGGPGSAPVAAGGQGAPAVAREAPTFEVIRPGGSLPAVNGRVIAHLTGTSTAMLRTAGELAAQGMPYLFSPMLPSVPSPFVSLAGRIAARMSVTTGPAKEAALAGRIAAGAYTVAARTEHESRYLRRAAGIPAVKLVTVPGPAVPETAVHGRREPGGPALRTLALAFCDAVTPEWNVLRFLFAMEKLNARGVIAAGRADSEYARECAARAALNPRIRFLFFEPGDAGAAAAEVARLAGEAAIVVDPSLRGLCGRVAAALAAAGVPSVVSARSLDASPPGPGMFTFEPSSWELLNHAVTAAFNRATLGHAVPGADVAAAGDREIALMLEQLYSVAPPA